MNMSFSRNGNGNLPTTAKDCSHCGALVGRFLHHVSLLGVLRRLCTSCVLRLHPSSFCPVCFSFYAGSPPHPSKRVSCSNCSCFTHSHCARDTLLSSYLCPPCKDSSFSFFPLRDKKIDRKLVLPLLCAVRIAAYSIGKADSVARADAERKTREAALAKRRLTIGLEQLFLVTNKGEASKKVNENNVSAEFSDANLVKFDELDMGNGDDDGDADMDIDVDLVRDIEDSLVKVEDIDFKLN